MIEISNVEIIGWEHAIRGMRNPLNSWDKSDSCLCKRDYDDCKTSPACDCPKNGDFDEDYFCIGEDDYKLMRKLARVGSDHAKYRRMITVYADIVAPLYWWKEYDTYKVGTVANSCSTMHKIHDKEFTLDDFSHEHLLSCNGKKGGTLDTLNLVISQLNYWRERYIIAKNKEVDRDTVKSYWWQMIQLLPSSYNQRRTVQLNYEVLANMYHSRRNHKLDEWVKLCKWIEFLPYSELITGDDHHDKNNS